MAVGAISGKWLAGRFKDGNCRDNHLLFALSDCYEKMPLEGLFSWSLSESTPRRKVCLIYISWLFWDSLAAVSISQYSLRYRELRIPPSFMWMVFAKQHLRHRDLLFAPPQGRWNDAVRVVALHLLCREVCVYVNSFCNTCISKPIQKLFLPPFVTSSLPQLRADKMVAVAMVSRNRHCFLNHCWGRLKIISGVAIRNVTGQQRINSS